MNKVPRIYVSVMGDESGDVSRMIAKSLSCKGFIGITVHNDILNKSFPLTQRNHMFPDVPGTTAVERVTYAKLFARIRLVSGSLVIVSEKITWPKI